MIKIIPAATNDSGDTSTLRYQHHVKMVFATGHEETIYFAPVTSLSTEKNQISK